MSHVVVYIRHFAREATFAKVLLEQFGNAAPSFAITDALIDQFQAWAVLDAISDFTPEVRTAVLVDRNDIDIRKLNLGCLQAVTNGFRWEASPMLDPPEPLFLDSCDQLSILYDAGGGISVKRV